MAKIGLEVEGKLKDEEVLTYFCSAEEFLDDESICEKLVNLEVEQLYISDHLNVLDLHELEHQFRGSGLIVTVEVTQLTKMPPLNIEIFWNASQASYAQASTIRFLRNGDQVKVESEKYVMSWVVKQAVLTTPDEFEGDREV